MQKQFRKKMKFSIISLATIVIILIVIASKNAPSYEHLDFENTDDGKVVGPILSSTVVKQTIVSKSHGLSRIDVFMATYARINNSNITFQITDEENNSIYMQTVSAKEIGDSAYYVLDFSPVMNSKGKKYTLILTSDTDDANNAVTVWMSNADRYTNGALYINNHKMEGDIAFKVFHDSAVDVPYLTAFSISMVVMASTLLLIYILLLRKTQSVLKRLIFWVISALEIALSIAATLGLFIAQYFWVVVLCFPTALIMTSFPFLYDNNLSKIGISNFVKQILPGIVLVLIFNFMLLIYEPIILFSYNKDEFLFDFEQLIFPLISVAGLGILVSTTWIVALFLINKLVSPCMKYFQSLVVILYVIFFATYIQGNWLSKDLSIIEIDSIQTEILLKNDIITILIWIGIIIFVVFSIIKFPLEQVVNCLKIISISIWVMVLSGAIVGTISNNALQRRGPVFIPTLDNFNVASNSKNFIIFLTDAVDSKVFENVLTANSKYEKTFDDFTYYSNALSAFAFTKYNIPVILTGQMPSNGSNYSEYTSEAYNSSRFFSELTMNGYKMNLYDNILLKWDGERRFDIKNALEYSKMHVKLDAFFREEMKYIMHKYLPYAYKKYSGFETFNLGSAFAFESKIDYTNSLYDWSDKSVYNYISENRTINTIADPMFMFIHLEGAHIPLNYDEELNVIENGTGTYLQKVTSTIKVIDAYIERLKENQVYDNSVIIIMADHGYYDNPDQENFLPRFNPMLLIKGVNEKHELVKSDLPISYTEDLLDAYKDLIMGKQSTELFRSVPKERTRVILMDGISKNSNVLEYKTSGNAWDWERFEPTGNVYNYR